MTFRKSLNIKYYYYGTGLFTEVKKTEVTFKNKN